MTDMDDSPATKVIISPSGRYDLNNISGKTKQELILSGQLTMNSFIAPDNTPGKKLAEIRESAKEQSEAQVKSMEVNATNKYQVGDLVNYKGFVTEVKEVDDGRLRITTRENKPKWVFHTKVQEVGLPVEEE